MNLLADDDEDFTNQAKIINYLIDNEDACYNSEELDFMSKSENLYQYDTAIYEKNHPFLNSLKRAIIINWMAETC